VHGGVSKSNQSAELCGICVLFIVSVFDPSVGGLLNVGCVDFQNLLASQPTSSHKPSNLPVKS
jgi:hypothetical protein